MAALPNDAPPPRSWASLPRRTRTWIICAAIALAGMFACAATDDVTYLAPVDWPLGGLAATVGFVLGFPAALWCAAPLAWRGGTISTVFGKIYVSFFSAVVFAMAGYALVDFGEGLVLFRLGPHAVYRDRAFPVHGAHMVHGKGTSYDVTIAPFDTELSVSGSTYSAIVGQAAHLPQLPERVLIADNRLCARLTLEHAAGLWRVSPAGNWGLSASRIGPCPPDLSGNPLLQPGSGIPSARD